MPSSPFIQLFACSYKTQSKSNPRLFLTTEYDKYFIANFKNRSQIFGMETTRGQRIKQLLEVPPIQAVVTLGKTGVRC
jgi:hypothetical protein